MADTIVHDHVAADDRSASGMGMGFIVGMVILIALVLAAVYFFGTGRFGNWGGTTTNNEVSVPVPDQVDVNVNPGTGGTQ